MPAKHFLTTFQTSNLIGRVCFTDPIKRTCFTNARKITIIKGDKPSSQIIEKTVDLLKKMNAPLKFDEFSVTGREAEKADILKDVIESVKENGVALKGHWETTSKSKISINHKLRIDLDLWANVVHVKSIPQLADVAVGQNADLDFFIIRQNTEGEYSHIEHEPVDGVVEMFKVSTKSRAEQIAQFAFDYANLLKRKKVSCVHKANIMKLGDGMFLRVCTQTSKKYPNIEYNNLIVDNCSMQLIQSPHIFDVIVTPNLYGNIMINISAGLVGSPNLLSGANFSTSFKTAVFEAASRTNLGHSKLQANPTSLLMATCHLLKHVGLDKMSKDLKSAVHKVLATDSGRTPDINGSSDINSFFSALEAQLDK